MSFKQKDFGIITDCKISFKDTNGKRHNYKWYSVWKNMLRRCYDKKNHNYYCYGAKGVYVSEELKIASVFRDWYLENNPNGDLVMDKDIICEEKGIYPKYYGKDTVIFISSSDNCKESVKRNYKKFKEHISNTFQDKESLKNKHYSESSFGGDEPKIVYITEYSPSMEFYEKNSLKRDEFKDICKNNKWEYDDFFECKNFKKYYELGVEEYYYLHKEKCNG